VTSKRKTPLEDKIPSVAVETPSVKALVDSKASMASSNRAGNNREARRSETYSTNSRRCSVEKVAKEEEVNKYRLKAKM